VPKLVLLRHGESEWNQQNRFTGWWDVGLSDRGKDEARRAGSLLAEEGFGVEVAHSSVLRRAIETLDLVLSEMGRQWVPLRRSWRLNERHYGALTGLNKAETRSRYGDEQFLAWRRSYAVPPPAMEPGHPYDVAGDERYCWLPAEVVPRTECLADVVARLVPYWQDAIAPDLLAGRAVLVSAHGNSIRALIKHLEAVPDDDIVELEIPTGVPIVYELSGPNLSVLSKRELGDPTAIAAATEAVRDQGYRAADG
jgi:2,3-bisphosphoglycerate-dependent phosphoglycerate mutase